MQINSINNTSFTGIPISKVRIKGLNSDYRLYEINHKDTEFLNKMYKSVNLKKLYPGLKEDDYIVWDGILRNAIYNGIRFSEKKMCLETCGNIPCGVITFMPAPKHYYLNYIVTFPNKVKQKVPFAGQILFNELFRRFIPHNSQNIELDALRDSPFSPISKYLKLGFKMFGGDNISEEMRINKQTAKDTFAKQNTFISSEYFQDKKEIDLNNTIELLTNLEPKQGLNI